MLRSPRAAVAALVAAALIAPAAHGDQDGSALRAPFVALHQGSPRPRPTPSADEDVATPRPPAHPCGRVRFIALYDSHGLTPYGDRLDALLLAHPDAELVSYTLGGASPSWLVRRPISPRGYFYDSCSGKPPIPRSRLTKHDLRAPSLDDLLRVPEGVYDRQVVVLTLGSNVPGDPGVLTAPIEQAVRTIDARRDATCVWVGPPAIRSWSASYADKVYAAIRDGIHAAEAGAEPRKKPACHLLDSRRLLSYPPGGDGTHLGFMASHVAAADKWADGVDRAIEQILRSER